VPIAFHAILGVIIAFTGQANVGRHGYARNWQYVLQRGSGIVLVFYILFHTWMTRFDSNYLHSPSAFAYVKHQVSNPGIFAFYVIGLLSACWHFGNGLFGFAIHWGLATGRKSQDMVSKLSMAVVIVLTLVGLNALLAFAGHGIYPGWLTKPHATESAGVAFQGGRH